MKCLCGCNRETKINRINKKFNNYIKGHFWKGKHHLKRTKIKIAEHFFGSHLSKKTKNKISLNNGRGMLGKHHSKKTRKKISKIVIKAWADGKLKMPFKKRTNIELLMYKGLIKNNYKVIQQYHIKSIGVVDFYLPKFNTVIECDGDYWHCNPKIFKANHYHRGLKIVVKKEWKKDKDRIKKLKTLGYKVLRFWGSDISNDLNKCLKLIKHEVRE